MNFKMELPDFYNILGQFILSGLVIISICFILYLFFRSPFRYPYFKYYFDISGKRKPDIEDLIDIFLNEKNFSMIKDHRDIVEKWKRQCQEKTQRSILRKYRAKQYKKSLDDHHAYIFYLIKQQTRYRQTNYIRTPYKVTQTVAKFSFDYDYLYRRNRQLEEIKNECTIKEYNSKNQRKLMTKELRHEIMARDNFTCQICGKHMPDEIGLHIDHIKPVSKGGKTVPSNLQVLCSKCNGKKSYKY